MLSLCLEEENSLEYFRFRAQILETSVGDVSVSGATFYKSKTPHLDFENKLPEYVSCVS